MELKRIKELKGKNKIKERRLKKYIVEQSYHITKYLSHILSRYQLIH